MSFISNIKNSWFRVMANQLRQPSGLLAKFTGTSMNRANELLYHLTLNNLNLKDGDHVLEIGFGNGKYFSDLHARSKNLKIFGIENSPEMVKEAISRNNNLYRSKVLEVTVGTSEKLPFENNSLDKIYCINVIYFWENPSRHLKEIYRVLKPGGSFCIGFRPKENLDKFGFTKFGFTLYSEEALNSLIIANGFKFVSIENGKQLEQKMNQENTLFESLCLLCVK